MKYTCVFTILLLFANYLQAQDCVYLAYESFDAPIQTLEGVHSGQTFKTSWYVQNDDNTAAGYRLENENPLGYGDLQVEGNYVQGGYEYLPAGRNLYISPTGFFGSYLNENDQIGAAGTDIWVSALLRKEEDNDQGITLSLHNDQLAWCQACASSSVGLGYYGDASNENGDRFWSININGTVHRSNIPVEIGETAFLALHITFGPITEVEAFFNPSELGFQQATPDLTINTNDLVEFQSIGLYLGSDIDNGSADEIRIGHAWECVSPDSEVTVNLPPSAQIDLLPSTGMAPFDVQHNGSNSTDPDSDIDHYEWVLFDNTTIEETVFNSVYSYPGQLDIALRVTDIHGAQNTAYATVTVLDENGSFPCLSALTLLQQANCETQSGGSLRVSAASDVTLMLTDNFNTIFSTTSWQQYDDLAPGEYSLLVTGDNLCTDDYNLVIPVDSSSCIGWEPQTCFDQFGMNLTGFADWGKERPMRNLFKHIRSSLPTFTDDCDCWDLDISDQLEYDENGYPTHLPQNTPVGDTKIRLVLSANAQGAEAGNLQPERTYVLLYDGVAEMSLHGVAQITSEEAGRIEFTTHPIPTLDNVIIDVHQSQLGDHLRNIRLLRIEDEFADLDAEPFYEGFLQKIELFTSLRFMDWGSTNGSSLQNWGDRTPIDFRTYGIESGAPYEMMIALANQTQKDVWICVPHLADSNYIQQMARLFRDELDEDLTIYLEYSNEVWNWIFPQAHHNLETAPANLNYGQAYAEKAKTIFRLWHNEFGGQTDRVQRVLGLQLTFNWLNEQILSHLDQEDWDYGSPTWYFGLGDQHTLNAESTPQDVVAAARLTFQQSMPLRRQDYRNIKLFGKGIIEYEGGQHFTNLTNEPWTQAIIDAQNLPEMYDLYVEVMDSLQVLGSLMPVAFALSGETDNIYNFGHMDDIDIAEPYSETARKYQAILDNICRLIDSTEDQGVDAKSNNGLRVFPNPIQRGASLFLLSERGVQTVEVYTMNGQVILTSRLNELDGYNHFITGSDWPMGIYMLRFTLVNGEMITKKLIVAE